MISNLFWTLEFQIVELVKILLFCFIVFRLGVSKQKKRFCIATGIIVTFALISVFAGNEIISIIYRHGVRFVCMLLLVDAVISSKVFAYLYSYFAISAYEYLLASLYTVYRGISYENFGENEERFLYLATAAIMSLIFIFVRKNPTVKRLGGKPIVYILALLLILIWMIYVAYITTNLEKGGSNNRPLYVCMLVSSLFFETVIILLYRIFHNYQELKTMELYAVRMQNEYQKNYYMDHMRWLEEMQKYKHDLKHHFRFINELILDNKYDQVQEYLHKMELQLRDHRKHRAYSGNPVVDSVINGILGNEIDQKKLRFDYEGILPEKINMEDVDLCGLLSNALENAFENSSVEHEKKTIQMQSIIHNNTVLFFVKNPVKYEDGLLYTGKQIVSDVKYAPQHGYGLKNMSRITKKYGGDIRTSLDNGWFTVAISLYL